LVDFHDLILIPYSEHSKAILPDTLFLSNLANKDNISIARMKKTASVQLLIKLVYS